MISLSRELAGVVLQHENYGSHLDVRRKTMDFILEKQNFEYAGKALAEYALPFCPDCFIQ